MSRRLIVSASLISSSTVLLHHYGKPSVPMEKQRLSDPHSVSPIMKAFQSFPMLPVAYCDVFDDHEKEVAKWIMSSINLEASILQTHTEQVRNMHKLLKHEIAAEEYNLNIDKLETVHHQIEDEIERYNQKLENDKITSAIVWVAIRNELQHFNAVEEEIMKGVQEYQSIWNKNEKTIEDETSLDLIMENVNLKVNTELREACLQTKLKLK